MPFLCCGPAFHFPGTALIRQGGGLPSTARCSIPVLRTVGDSRGSRMKRLGTKANATANTLSTCIRLEQLRPGHFPTLGPLALLYRIALVYLTLTSRTSALLRPHHVRLALLMPQRLAPPARSPSPSPARIAGSPHRLSTVPPTLNTAIASTTLLPRSLPLFLSSVSASRTNCFRCFFLYFGLFHLPSTCPGGAFSFNRAYPIHPNASQQVSFIGLS
jgi:hypothetical protein